MFRRLSTVHKCDTEAEVPWQASCNAIASHGKNLPQLIKNRAPRIVRTLLNRSATTNNHFYTTTFYQSSKIAQHNTAHHMYV